MIFPMVWRGIIWLDFWQYEPPPSSPFHLKPMYADLINKTKHLSTFELYMTVTNLFIYYFLIFIFVLHPDQFSFPLVFPGPHQPLLSRSTPPLLPFKRSGILGLATKYDLLIRLGTCTYIKAGWDNPVGEKRSQEQTK